MATQTFTDEIRQAIKRSGVTQYAIWNKCGIDKGNMSKFMAGKAGLSLDLVDQIAAMLDLHVALAPKAKAVNRGKRSK